MAVNMDKIVVGFCVFLIALAFYLVIRSVVRQLRGGRCAGCPLSGGSGCGACGGKSLKKGGKRETRIGLFRKKS